MKDTRPSRQQPPIRRARAQTTVLLSAAVVLGTVALMWFVPALRLFCIRAINLLGSGDISALKTYLATATAAAPWTGPALSFVLMVLSSVIAPLPAFAITFANGMLWGWVAGAALSWTSAMAGAALCFWLSRAFGRPVVTKLAGGTKALELSDLFFERYGSRAVLITRLLPFVSFDLISYGAGLTDIGFGRFMLATGIGQLPATLVYSYIASIGGAATSVRILLYVFAATMVLLLLAQSLRAPFMRYLEQRKERSS